METAVHCKILRICFKNEWKTCKKSCCCVGYISLNVNFYIPCKILIDFLFFLHHLLKYILYRKQKAGILATSKWYHCGVFSFLSRSSRPEVFRKKNVLMNFAKFTGKHLCQSLFFNKVAGLRPETFFTEHLRWL